VSDVRSFFPEPAEDEEELLGGATERWVVFGHTHLPFWREGPGGVELVNPGSVGMPFDGDPRAAYALVHEDGRVEHRRVTYDHAASAAAVRERFDGDWTETVARRIQRAEL
jgi:diadenosine tetraphosphatase ApaH/serine/threonine PP2A family protein phosphatase